MSAEQQSSVGKRNRQERPPVAARAGAPVPAATLETDRDQLVINHVGLVKAMAHGWRSGCQSQVEINELISVGVLGLIDAADRYKPALGVPFDAFARRRVPGRDARRAARPRLGAALAAPHAARPRQADRPACVTTLGREPNEDEVAAAMGMSRGRIRRDARAGRAARDSGAIRQLDATSEDGLAAARVVRRSGRRPGRAARAHELRDAAGAGPSASCPSASARSWPSTTRKS